MKILIGFVTLSFLSFQLSATKYYNLTSWATNQSVNGVWSTSNGGASCNCTPNFAADSIILLHDVDFLNGLSLTTGYLEVENGATASMGAWGGSFTTSNSASIYIKDGGEITTRVGFENAGNLFIEGTLTIENAGTGKFTNSGNTEIASTGTIQGQTPNNGLENASPGTITVQPDGFIDIGPITNNSGASFYVYGTVDQRTTWNSFTNAGLFYIDGLVEAGQITNSGAINGNGILERTSNSSTNSGTINGCNSCSFVSVNYLANIPNANSAIYQNGWVNGTTPNASLDAVILTDYNGAAITCDNLYISKYITAEITANTSWTIGGDIENEGTLLVQNNASLIQTTNTDSNTGSGSYQVIRNSGQVLGNTYYNYWASPLSDASLETVFSQSNQADFYSYLSGSWSNVSGNMDPGIGYATTSDINASYPTSFNRTFEGTSLNNGTIQVNGISGSSVLVGNPYPSGLDASAFATANTNVGTFHFWDHNTHQSINAGNTVADYATFTKGSGGVKATTGSTIPTGNISSGQGFFIDLLSGSSVTFENNQRVSTNNQFFSPLKEERNRAWINLTNTHNDFNQLLICLSDFATDGYDRLYDGKKLKGNPNIAFYTMLNNEEYAIQGLRKPTVDSVKLIPLGVDAGLSGSYTIAIDSLNNWPSDFQLFLTDLEENNVINLADSNYTFEVNQSGNITERFHLSVSIKASELSEVDENNALGQDDLSADLSDILTYTANNSLWIKNQSSIELERADIYSLSGKILVSTALQTETTSVDVSNLSAGVYLVHLSSSAGKTISRKFVLPK